MSTALAKGTRANKISQLKITRTFFNDHGLNYCPPTQRSLTSFMEFLARTGKGYKTIRAYITLLIQLNRAYSTNIRVFKSYETIQMMKCLKATIPYTADKRQPISANMLKRLIEKCPILEEESKMMAFTLALAFCGFLRRSNLAPRTLKEFNHRKHATMKDIEEVRTGLSMTVKWTKTRQNASPLTLYIPSIPGSKYDPKKLWRNYILSCKRIPSKKYPPLLQTPDGSSVTLHKLAKNLATLVSAIGQDPHTYTFHAL